MWENKKNSGQGSYRGDNDVIAKLWIKNKIFFRQCSGRKIFKHIFSSHRILSVLQAFRLNRCPRYLLLGIFSTSMICSRWNYYWHLSETNFCIFAFYLIFGQKWIFLNMKGKWGKWGSALGRSNESVSCF